MAHQKDSLNYRKRTRYCVSGNGTSARHQEARQKYGDSVNENEPKIVTATAAQEVVTEIVMSDVKRFAEKRHTMVADYIAAIKVLGG